jgi:hypothetical protein
LDLTLVSLTTQFELETKLTKTTFDCTIQGNPEVYSTSENPKVSWKPDQSPLAKKPATKKAKLALK